MKWTTSILIFCVAALLGLGLVMLYSATATKDGTHFLFRQLTGIALGLTGCALASAVDYRHLRKVSPYLLGLAAILLVLVFIPTFSVEVNGARRWLGKGSFRFQPSEFAKIALVVFLAHYIEHYQRRITNIREGLMGPGLVVCLVVGLVFTEPDRGCAILLTAVAGGLLIIGGVQLRYIIPPALLAVGGFVVSILHDPMRLQRVMAWLHPERARETAGFQAYQAMIALGSGGWLGLGLGNSRQKRGFVPEHQTDFIFSIIGEELGLIATLAVVVGFVIIIVCGTVIARRASDTFGMLLAIGMTFLIGCQAFINIGVVTSTLPNKGMPLPFISYGPSNMIMMLLAVGFMLSVSRFAVQSVKSQSNPFDNSSAEYLDE